jgi:hypothetical protein
MPAVQQEINDDGCGKEKKHVFIGIEKHETPGRPFFKV